MGGVLAAAPARAGLGPIATLCRFGPAPPRAEADDRPPSIPVRELSPLSTAWGNTVRPKPEQNLIGLDFGEKPMLELG